MSIVHLFPMDDEIEHKPMDGQMEDRNWVARLHKRGRLDER